MINNAQKLNAVTIHDAGLPPSADEFAECFAGHLVYTIGDLFSGYDQVSLHVDSRDMTAFQTDAGLVRYCTMVMGATNSVAAFLRIIHKIIYRHYPDHADAFIDDVVNRGGKDDYGNEEALPGIRWYVLEHIIRGIQLLADFERAEATISGPKSEWGVDRLAIVGYKVGWEGRYPQAKKIAKIMGWPTPRNKTEVRKFVGIAVYYRQFVKWLSQTSKPFFILLRVYQLWIWDETLTLSMQTIKESICLPPALVAVDYKLYEEDLTLQITFKIAGHDGFIGTIYITVDGSAQGAGAHVEQLLRDGKRQPVRFESTLWSEAESY
jgi:hypothetical protein